MLAVMPCNPKIRREENSLGTKEVKNTRNKQTTITRKKKEVVTYIRLLEGYVGNRTATMKDHAASALTFICRPLITEQRTKTNKQTNKKRESVRHEMSWCLPACAAWQCRSRRRKSKGEKLQ